MPRLVHYVENYVEDANYVEDDNYMLKMIIMLKMRIVLKMICILKMRIMLEKKHNPNLIFGALAMICIPINYFV